MSLNYMNLLRILSITVLVIFSACSPNKPQRELLINEYENTKDNQQHIHRNQFKNRIDENTSQNPRERIWAW
jgi:hypothetical protein